MAQDAVGSEGRRCGNQPGKQEQAGLEKHIKIIPTSHPTSLLTEKQQNHKSYKEKEVGKKLNRPNRREWNRMISKVPSSSASSRTLWFCVLG